jgi:hypothetical protein
MLTIHLIYVGFLPLTGLSGPLPRKQVRVDRDPSLGL